MSLTITNWFFDQAVYNSGQTITLTINYVSTNQVAANVANAIAVSVTDSSDSAAQTSDGGASFPDFAVAGVPTAAPTAVSVSDRRSQQGVWTQVSNVLSGDTAPFSGVAVFTSVA